MTQASKYWFNRIKVKLRLRETFTGVILQSSLIQQNVGILLHTMNAITSTTFICIICILSAKILHKPRDFSCSLMVVFGDSLTDDGIEVADESHGFERLSNGPVWPEYMNQMLGCDRYINYAYSGAKSGRDNFYFPNWSGVLWQVEKFTDSHPVLPEDSLIVLQAGGSTDFFIGDNSTQEVVENTHKAINLLVKSMSSGTLFLLNLLDQTSAPGIMNAEDGADLQRRISSMVAHTNMQLGHIIYDSELGVRRRAPGVSVRLIDLNGAVIRASATLNTTDPFTHHTRETRPGSIYNYAYHDLWHPSTFVHHKIASTIVRELQDL